MITKKDNCAFSKSLMCIEIWYARYVTWLYFRRKSGCRKIQLIPSLLCFRSCGMCPIRIILCACHAMQPTNKTLGWCIPWYGVMSKVRFYTISSSSLRLDLLPTKQAIIDLFIALSIPLTVAMPAGGGCCRWSYLSICTYLVFHPLKNAWYHNCCYDPEVQMK